MSQENDLNKPKSKEELDKLLGEQFDTEQARDSFKQNFEVIKNLRDSLDDTLDNIQIGKHKTYSDKDIGNYLINILEWLIENKSAVFIKEYYFDPNVKFVIPWDTVKSRFLRNEKLQKIRDLMNDVLEIRLVKAALNGEYRENMTKFLMINNYGYKSEKVDQDLKITGNEIKFEFGNDDIEDKDKDKDSNE